MNKDKIYKGLEEAEKNIFCFTNFDISYDLGRENMRKGVYKMRYFLEEMGRDPDDLLVVFGPDGTITRNKTRFGKGISYGCAISSKEYAFPTFYRPNTCGFGVYKIPDFEESNLERVVENQDRLVEEGINLKVPGSEEKEISDTHKSNHFIDIFEVQGDVDENIDLERGDHVTIVHCNSQIYKDELYNYPEGDKVKVETPLGEIEGLRGDSLDDYMNLFQKVEELSMKKRTAVAEKLFGSEIEEIVNKTHQGIFKENDRYVMRLGVHNSINGEGEGAICPMTFNAYNPMFLYKGKENVKRRYWTKNQEERAEETGIEDLLENINILPHGGGYELPLPFTEAEISLMNGNEVFFNLKSPAHKAPYTIRPKSVRSLEFSYRNPEKVINSTKRFEMGEKVATLSPKHIMKI